MLDVLFEGDCYGRGLACGHAYVSGIERDHFCAARYYHTLVLFFYRKMRNLRYTRICTEYDGNRSQTVAHSVNLSGHWHFFLLSSLQSVPSSSSISTW